MSDYYIYYKNKQHSKFLIEDIFYFADIPVEQIK